MRNFKTLRLNMTSREIVDIYQTPIYRCEIWYRCHTLVRLYTRVLRKLCLAILQLKSNQTCHIIIWTPTNSSYFYARFLLVTSSMVSSRRWSVSILLFSEWALPLYPFIWHCSLEQLLFSICFFDEIPHEVSFLTSTHILHATTKSDLHYRIYWLISAFWMQLWSLS